MSKMTHQSPIPNTGKEPEQEGNEAGEPQRGATRWMDKQTKQGGKQRVAA